MDPNDPFFSTIVGTGIIGMLVSIAFFVLAFVLSAFIMALWIRLILVFMRKALDREYGRMRMASYGFEPGRAPAPAGPMPLRNGEGPRDW